MPRPKIVKETRREAEEKEPPSRAAILPHDWLSEESAELYRRAVGQEEPFDLYLSWLSKEKIMDHALKEAPKRLEVMGFLLGEVYKWKGRPYALVRDVVTTNLKSSSAKVRFDPAAFPRLFSKLDGSGFDYILVGWYHSHPGHTCFLSGTDLETQRAMFSQEYHSAVVIDPLNKDIKAFKLDGVGYREVPFAVLGQGVHNVKRTRKLKTGPSL
jgi:26S proteasome regulatory subunit N11